MNRHTHIPSSRAPVGAKNVPSGTNDLSEPSKEKSIFLVLMESAATTTMMMTPTDQDINEVDTDLFASSEDEAELQRRENLRARDTDINNLNTDRRNTGK